MVIEFKEIQFLPWQQLTRENGVLVTNIVNKEPFALRAQFQLGAQQGRQKRWRIWRDEQLIREMKKCQGQSCLGLRVL